MPPGGRARRSWTGWRRRSRPISIYDPNIAVDRHPTVREAKAHLDRARLDLSYAVVLAPDDGIVTKVDELQVGDFVNAGAPVFSLLSSHHVWIEANFRETGLTYMRPGQEATIDVDAYPDRTFKAHVSA
jgi:membrane fusion protein (multidrug efflux system)